MHISEQDIGLQIIQLDHCQNFSCHKLVPISVLDGSFICCINKKTNMQD